MNLNEAKEELDSMIRAQQFDKAAMLKNQVTELEEEKTVLQNQLNENNSAPTRVERVRPMPGGNGYCFYCFCSLRYLFIVDSMLSDLK